MTRHLETDPEQVEHDLARLVLTLVELIRQLMERQALRRFEDGSLSDGQIESVGLTFLRLEEAMTRLKDHFGLTDDELNLDLGPLGTLLPEPSSSRWTGPSAARTCSNSSSAVCDSSSA